MALLPPADRPRLPAPAAVVVALLVLLGPAARGEEDNVYYSRQPSFRIPFQVDPGDRRVQQVVLYVSEDQGRTYQQAGTGTPADRGFTFQARRDGWYFFAVQTVDQEGKLYPPNLVGVQPGLRVFVDTVAPTVTVRALASAPPNAVGIEWDLRDELLDLSTLRLEYRSTNGDWTTRGIQRVYSGQLTWDPGVPGAVEVRLSVKDRAGNPGEATTTLRGPDGGGGGGGVGGGNGGGNGGNGNRPMNRADDGQPPVRTDRAEYPTPGNVRKVNSSKISLDYRVDDVGPSDVSAIEIWIKKENGAWQKYSKEAARRPPFVIDVTDGEGRYGLSLIAKSGVGLGERSPQANDPPQAWVEVDLTKPAVRLVDTVVGRGAETGNLTITWSATDKNLSRQPISLFYANNPSGPWTPVPGATNLDNTGRYAWRMQDGLPFEFHVRVEAIDEAGNVGTADTQKTVKVDLSLPKARVIGIEPARP